MIGTCELSVCQDCKASGICMRNGKALQAIPRDIPADNLGEPAIRGSREKGGDN